LPEKKQADRKKSSKKTKSVPHKIKSKEVQTETPVEADPLEETKKFTGKNKV